MKKVNFLVALALVNLVSFSALAEDEKVLLAKEYIELSKTKEIFDSTIEAYVTQISQQNPKVNKDELRKIFNSYMGWEVLKDPSIEIVSRMFTVKELQDANTFYRSASGKAIAEKSPQMSAELANLVANNFNKAIEHMQTQ